MMTILLVDSQARLLENAHSNSLKTSDLYKILVTGLFDSVILLDRISFHEPVKKQKEAKLVKEKVNEDIIAP